VKSICYVVVPGYIDGRFVPVTEIAKRYNIPIENCFNSSIGEAEIDANNLQRNPDGNLHIGGNGRVTKVLNAQKDEDYYDLGDIDRQVSEEIDKIIRRAEAITELIKEGVNED